MSKLWGLKNLTRFTIYRINNLIMGCYQVFAAEVNVIKPFRRALGSNNISLHFRQLFWPIDLKLEESICDVSCKSLTKDLSDELKTFQEGK